MEMLWNPEDTKWLQAKWQTMSASQIAKELHRTRSAICGKIGRLRRAGVLTIQAKPGGAGKPFAINPRVGHVRPKRDNVSHIKRSEERRVGKEC